MEKRSFGKTGMELSVLGFGGAEIGFDRVSETEVAHLLGAALDAGLNVIDTAECYGSEGSIGAAVAHRRDDFHLFTKCGHSGGFPEEDWDSAMLEKTIDRSLSLLKTDYLDLIQLHSCSEDLLRQGDVIAILQRARDAGKTRFIGYSGDSAAALYAIQCGAFDSLQTSVNIADQECIDLTLPEAARAGMGVIAKRPIANVAWKSGSNPPENNYHKSYWERLGKLEYPFLRPGADADAVSITLRFTLAQTGVTTAIVGTTKPDRWKENAALLDAGPLAPDQIQAIRDRWRAVAGTDWVGQG